MHINDIHVFVGTDIPDVWFQCIYYITEKGTRYTIDKGSFEGEDRLELDLLTIFKIRYPYNDNYDAMLPKIPAHLSIPDPVEPGYIEKYMPYLMTDTINSGEDYTYGSRIADQIEYWSEVLKKTPATNQAILQVARPEDCFLEDPPCLRHIDIRVRNNKLHFYPYFRSWDLWGGMPANLAAISVLQKYMADNINIDMGYLIASSKGIHIYQYVHELAKIRTCKN
ncbi:MAG: thymidylate synthase [bacterium]